MDELTLWQYTAMVGEHNRRMAEMQKETTVQPMTKEEYYAERQILRDRGDPSIQV